MPHTVLNDTKLIQSWQQNATPWTHVVRHKLIESRQLVTDQAIISAALSQHPRSLIDLGCGEGWLVRALAGQGIKVLGIDAVPELIEHAQQQSADEFRVLSFEDIAAGALNEGTERIERVDSIVCNFSLLGEASVAMLFQTIPSLLNPGGYLLVQTLHPLLAGSETPYCNGWREETWAGFEHGFRAPAPCYFRTLASWIDLHVSNGLQLQAVQEPMHPKHQQPASILFISRTAL